MLFQKEIMVYVNRLDSIENILPYDYDRLVFLNFLVLLVYQFTKFTGFYVGDQFLILIIMFIVKVK